LAEVEIFMRGRASPKPGVGDGLMLPLVVQEVHALFDLCPYLGQLVVDQSRSTNVLSVQRPPADFDAQTRSEFDEVELAALHSRCEHMQNQQ
jgi:hypothetical protein